MKNTLSILIILSFLFIGCELKQENKPPTKPLNKAQKVDKLIGTMHGNNKKVVSKTLEQVNKRHEILKNTP